MLRGSVKPDSNGFYAFKFGIILFDFFLRPKSSCEIIEES